VRRLRAQSGGRQEHLLGDIVQEQQLAVVRQLLAIAAPIAGEKQRAQEQLPPLMPPWMVKKHGCCCYATAHCCVDCAPRRGAALSDLSCRHRLCPDCQFVFAGRWCTAMSLAAEGFYSYFTPIFWTSHWQKSACTGLYIPMPKTKWHHLTSFLRIRPIAFWFRAELTYDIKQTRALLLVYSSKDLVIWATGCNVH